MKSRLSAQSVITLKRFKPIINTDLFPKIFFPPPFFPNTTSIEMQTFEHYLFIHHVSKPTAGSSLSTILSYKDSKVQHFKLG